MCRYWVILVLALLDSTGVIGIGFYWCCGYWVILVPSVLRSVSVVGITFYWCCRYLGSTGAVGSEFY